MGYPIQQSQTAQPLPFLLVLSSDHLTGATGKSPTVTLSKNGGAFAAPAGAVTEIGNGWYQVAGNATDANTLGPLILHATAAASDATDELFPVVSYNPQDATRMGMTALPNAAAEAAGGLYTRGAGAGQINQQANGQIDANVARWLNTAAAAPNTNGVPLVDVGRWVGVVPNALSSGKVDSAHVMRGGTAQAGAAGSVTFDSGASATDNLYRGQRVTLVSGTGAGQTRLITGYTGSSKVATVAPNWTTNPDATSVFIVGAWAGVDLELWELTTPNVLVSGRVDASVGSYPGNTAQTGDNYARLGTPAGASVSADVAGVLAKTPDAAHYTNARGDNLANLTGDAYVRLGAPAGASIAADIAEIEAETDAIGTPLQAGNVTVGAYAAGQDPATLVLDATASAHNGAGTIGADINGAVLDTPGTTTLLGRLTAGRATNLDNLDAAVSTRSTLGGTAQSGDNFARLGAPAGASVSADIAAVNAKTTNLPASPAAVGSAMALTSGERDSVADALLDRANAVEVGLTPRQAMRLMSAALAGKVSGAGTTTIVIRNAVADSKPRITATVDAQGDRSAITWDSS